MEMINKHLDEIITSILFISGQGIEVKYIAEKLAIKEDKINKSIERLKEKFSGDCGIKLISYKGKVQLASNSDYADYVAEVLNPIREKQLTRATLETVAIICYKQPITKLEIEEIRGSNSDYAMQILKDHNLIEVVGRKDAVGNPYLYGTTEEFLKRFEIEDLNDLPDYEEILSRIEVIHNETESLYNNFKIPDEEQVVPEFLEGENIIEITSDDSSKIDNIEETDIDE